MCGITGFSGGGDLAALRRMTASLTHRGPDDSGVFFQNAVGLGHTRLSIIDTSARGHQPMQLPSGLTIVFNGEIYNYRELRSNLETKGIRFASDSDTEVLLRLFEAEGAECFKKLNGMFALAIFDPRDNSITLARDRFGKKPLYYSTQGNALTFGSELKALQARPGLTFELDPIFLQQYLFYEYVPTPRTIWKTIYKLEPGSYLVWKNGRAETKTFFQLYEKITAISFSEARQELDRLLEAAVRRRLIADVPLGIFLSGGIDSSTIAYFAQKISTKPVKTFSISFGESSFDESAYAESVAKHLGTDHTTSHVSAKEALEILPRLPEICDEPLADASLIPTYLLSRETRKHVTVALGGDGADELLYGYQTFQALRVSQSTSAIPVTIQKALIKAGARLVSGGDTYMNTRFVLEQYARGLSQKPAARPTFWMSSFTPEMQDELLTESFRSPGGPDTILAPLMKALTAFHSKDAMRSASAAYLTTYLLDDILVKVDRASMASALEVRAPFLDPDIAAFILSLPNEYKLRGFQTKYILKQLMADRLPRESVYRKKHGFAIPVARWLRNELKPLGQELFERAALERQGIFNPDYVSRIWQEHQSGKQDHRKELWTLLVFEMWESSQ